MATPSFVESRNFGDSFCIKEECSFRGAVVGLKKILRKSFLGVKRASYTLISLKDLSDPELNTLYTVKALTASVQKVFTSAAFGELEEGSILTFRYNRRQQIQKKDSIQVFPILGTIRVVDKIEL